MGLYKAKRDRKKKTIFFLVSKLPLNLAIDPPNLCSWSQKSVLIAELGVKKVIVNIFWHFSSKIGHYENNCSQRGQTRQMYKSVKSHVMKKFLWKFLGLIFFDISLISGQNQPIPCKKQDFFFFSFPQNSWFLEIMAVKCSSGLNYISRCWTVLLDSFVGQFCWTVLLNSFVG